MAEAPPTKRLKTGREDESELPADYEELEQDAKADGRLKLKEPVVFRVEELTLNITPSVHGNMLVPLSDGGLQYFLGGARASVGVRSGRYMFEVKVVELVNPVEEAQARGRLSTFQRHLLRVGVSTAGSPLLMIGEGEDSSSIFFDLDGTSGAGKNPSGRFSRGEVLCVVLAVGNSSGPNANTVSLFRDGQRVAKPQPLPEELCGKALYPTVTMRNVTVHCNFGPTHLVPLAFECRMWQDAAQSDTSITPSAPSPKDGKFEVIFPVLLPDEGTFDWLDQFLERNPSYTELSDRMILDWAQKSGITRPKGFGPSSRTCNDRPEYSFGLNLLDDASVSRILQFVAPLRNQNFVVMEVRANLLKDERKELLSRWPQFNFRRVAVVMLGEPSMAIKRRTQDLLLEAKQAASDAEFKRAHDEAKRQKVVEKRQKEQETLKRKQERVKKRLEEEEAKKKLAAELGLPEPEKATDDPMELDAESAEEKEPDVGEVEETPPKVSLSNEEKRQFFFKSPVPDLSVYSVSTSFTKFSVPEKEEGFDEIRYEWQKADKCKTYLRTWIQERKLTTRVEDITPSDWFSNKWKDWQKMGQAWHAKASAFRTAAQKKAEELATREAAKKKKEAEENALREMKAKAAADAALAGIDGPPEAAEEAAPEEPAKAEEEPLGEGEQMTDAEFERLDVFGVEDFFDVGGGRPLFCQFIAEDWTMMALRYEIHLLVHAFKRDVNDPDRLGIHVDHLMFYYSRYYKKQFNTKLFGVDTIRELLPLIRDTVVVAKNHVVEAQLPDDLESNGIFVMLTEEARRDRQRRLDLGDESARLRIMQSGQALPGIILQPVAPASSGHASVLGAGNGRPILQLGGMSMGPGRPLMGATAGQGWAKGSGPGAWGAGVAQPGAWGPQGKGGFGQTTVRPSVWQQQWRGR